MLNLIISIVSIALVAAMSAAGLYYGGKAWSDNAASGEARQIVSSAEQVAAALQLRMSIKGSALDIRALDTNEDWVLTLEEAFPALESDGILSSIPSVPRDAGGNGFSVAQYWDGSGEITASVSSVDMCSAVNQGAGFTKEEAESLANEGRLPNTEQPPSYTQPSSYIAGWGDYTQWLPTDTGNQVPETFNEFIYTNGSGGWANNRTSHSTTYYNGLTGSTRYDLTPEYTKARGTNYRIRKIEAVHQATQAYVYGSSALNIISNYQIQGFCPYGGTFQYNGINADSMCNSAPSCPAGEERKPDGQCVAMCPEGHYRDQATGSCQYFWVPPDPREDGRLICKSGAFRLRF